MSTNKASVDLGLVERIAAQARAVDPEDGELLADMIEGCTDAFELADILIERDATIATYSTALRLRVAEVGFRLKRLEWESECNRRSLAHLLEAMGERKLERPEGTISLRRVPPSLLDGPVENLPPHLTRVKVEPDKKAIKEAIEAGEDVPGWQLNNGGQSLSVRRK